MNRVVVITGASSGIGLEMARQFAAGGDRVYALARRLPDSVAEPSEAAAGSWFTMPLDVTDAEAARQAVTRIAAREGRIDILVQAAGYGLAGSVEAMTPTDAAGQMGTNFLGACHLLGPVLASMRARGSGLIIQLGSVAGFLPIPFQACYSASKAALAALTMALANEVRPFGIRCMLVQPGDTRTGFTEARVLCDADESLPYAERCRRSIARMAADEQNGFPADRLAAKIIRQANRRRPPLVYTPGLFYKLAALLSRVLPRRWVMAVLYGLYAR